MVTIQDIPSPHVECDTDIKNSSKSILDIREGQVIYRKDGTYKDIPLTYVECDTEHIILFDGDCPIFLPLDENTNGWHISPIPIDSDADLAKWRKLSIEYGYLYPIKHIRLQGDFPDFPNLSNIKVSGDIILTNVKLKGGLSLTNAEIGGNLDLSGVSCGTYCEVSLSSANIKGSVNLTGLRAFTISLYNTTVDPASLTPVAPITRATIDFLKSIPLDKLKMEHWQSNDKWLSCKTLEDFNECGTAVCIRGWAEVLYYLQNGEEHPHPDELYRELKHMFHMGNKQAREWTKYYINEYPLPS